MTEYFMTVTTTVFAGIAIVILRERYIRSVAIANNAIRLKNYVRYFVSFMNDGELKDVYLLGRSLNWMIQYFIKNGHPTDELFNFIAKRTELKKHFLNEIAEKIEKEKSESGDLEHQLDEVDILEFLSSLVQLRKDILDGKLFLTDDETTILGPMILSLTTDIKLDLYLLERFKLNYSHMRQTS